MTQEPSRDLALIGAGEWGRNLARCFDAQGALGLLVASTETEAARTELKQKFPQARLTTSVSDALGDPRIRQVAIAAPSAVHYELAHAALEADKDVFVEKPLCLRLEHARELTELAERKGRVLMVGHLLRYHPCVVKLCELVAQGTLGRLFTITSRRLNLGKFRKEENALWSFAPHDVSVILALLGDRLPQSVHCVGGAYLTPDVADFTLTSMRFADNVMAQIHVSWLNPFKEQKLTVVGSDGMAVFDDTKPWAEKLVIYRNYINWAANQAPVPVSAAAEAIVVPEHEPLAAECAHFRQACATRSRPRTDGAEGVRVMSILDLADRSLKQQDSAVRPSEGVQPVDVFVHPTATVEAGAEVGSGTRIWHHSRVMRGAKLGQRCNLGQNVCVESGALLGSDVKIQNNVSVYSGVELGDAVFLGPACVLTNVKNPRAEVDRRALYETTKLGRGVTVGANATVVCGVTLGRYAFVAAGAVVTSDAPDYALLVGNPARQVGYMSRHGHRLAAGPDGIMTCPEFGLRYRELEPGVVRCLDLQEDAPLPIRMRTGQRRYDELKA